MTKKEIDRMSTIQALAILHKYGVKTRKFHTKEEDIRKYGRLIAKAEKISWLHFDRKTSLDDSMRQVWVQRIVNHHNIQL
jgi:hypothetical protein